MSGDGATEGRRAVCAGCGCLCDDVPLDGPPWDRDRPNVGTSCEVGRRWFARRMFGGGLADRRITVDGRPASLAEAADRAAELLAGAAHPRLSGLHRLPLEAQRRLVEVADRAGAEICATPSPAHLGTVLAVQRQGGTFLTLGEMRERADCLVLWYAEPGRTHPRLLQRFWPPAGDGEDAGDRTLIAVGPRAGQTGADQAVALEPDRSLAFLWLLRLLADDPEAPEGREHPLGEAAAGVLEAVREAGSGAWIYGAPDAEGGGGPGARGVGAGEAGEAAPAEAVSGAGRDPVETVGVLRLLERLNEGAPWGALSLRGEGNAAGAEAVLTWQAGYPAAVTYRDGRPGHAGPAYAAPPPGTRDDADVVLLAGGEPGSAGLAPGTRCIWLDTGEAAGGEAGSTAAGGAGAGAEPAGGRAVAVRIPVLPPGARAGDTLLRMDGLAVRSGGVPGAGEWSGRPAEAALDAIVGELAGRKRKGTRP